MESLAEYRDRLPYDFYASLRAARHPVWDEGMKVWLVATHETCRKVQLREETHFVPVWSELPAETVRVMRGSERSHTAARGAQHKAQHLHLVRMLMPSNISRVLDVDLIDIVCDAARSELANLLAAGGGNLAEGWLDQLPLTLFLNLLQLDFTPEERERVWSNIRSLHRLNEFFDRNPQVMQEATAAADEMNERLLPVINSRKSPHNRGNDLISYLWATGPSVLENWNERDVLAGCRGLFGAGTMTTYHLLCNLVYRLGRDPELQEQLRKQPDELLPGFVAEAIRFEPPVHYRPRFAMDDIELDGADIRQGDEVLVLIASANRDELFNDRAETFDLYRDAPTTLHSFYRGRRSCAGATLARTEAVEIMKVLLQTARMELTAPDDAVLTGHMFRAYRPLTARLSPIG